MGAEALLKAMLTPGEFADYMEKVQEVCGFSTPIQDEVDEYFSAARSFHRKGPMRL